MRDEKCPGCGAGFDTPHHKRLGWHYAQCGRRWHEKWAWETTMPRGCLERQLAESQRLLGEATVRADKAEKAANDAEAHWRDEVIGAKVARDKADLKAQEADLRATAAEQGAEEARKKALLEAIALVRKYLVYDSQRAVSWHEIQDTIELLELMTEEPQ